MSRYDTSAVSSVRSHAERRTVLAAAGGDPRLAGAIVVLAIIAAWAATIASGGSKTALPHAFYFAVIIGAIRFGPAGALITAVAAGVAAGPLTPLDVEAGTSQLGSNWLTRIMFFVLVGQLTAVLARQSLSSMVEEVRAYRFRRDLDRAIAERQFRIEYQPIVELASGDVIGAEALIRWDHPTQGPISPCEFIPQAEHLGRIGDITGYVLTEVIAQAEVWHRTVLEDRTMFKLAVNISTEDLSDNTTLDLIAKLVAGSTLPRNWLHLEVTETALVDDIEAAVAGMQALRALGVKLAVDDFGTGESSLAYLHMFPVDVVKIDKIFLDRLEHHERGDLLVEGIITLIHTLRLRAVAEGVEHQRQAELLTRLGCDFAQGYLFSRPLTPAALELLLVNDVRIGGTGAVHVARCTPVHHR